MIYKLFFYFCYRSTLTNNLVEYVSLICVFAVIVIPKLLWCCFQNIILLFYSTVILTSHYIFTSKEYSDQKHRAARNQTVQKIIFTGKFILKGLLNFRIGFTVYLRLHFLLIMLWLCLHSFSKYCIFDWRLLEMLKWIWLKYDVITNTNFIYYGSDVFQK